MLSRALLSSVTLSRPLLSSVIPGNFADCSWNYRWFAGKQTPPVWTLKPPPWS